MTIWYHCCVTNVCHRNANIFVVAIFSFIISAHSFEHHRFVSYSPSRWMKLDSGFICKLLLYFFYVSVSKDERFLNNGSNTRAESDIQYNFKKKKIENIIKYLTNCLPCDIRFMIWFESNMRCMIFINVFHIHVYRRKWDFVHDSFFFAHTKVTEKHL